MFFYTFRKIPVLSQHSRCGPPARISRSLRRISFFAKFFKRKPPAIKCDIVKDKSGKETKCICTPYDFSKPKCQTNANFSSETFFPLKYKGRDPVTHNHAPLPMANYAEIFGHKDQIKPRKKPMEDFMRKRENQILDRKSTKGEIKADDDDCEKELEEVVDLSKTKNKDDNFCPRTSPVKEEGEDEKNVKITETSKELVLMKQGDAAEEVKGCNSDDVRSEMTCYVGKDKGDFGEGLCAEGGATKKTEVLEKNAGDCKVGEVEPCKVACSSVKESDCKPECAEDDARETAEDCVLKKEDDLIQLPECVLNSKSVLCKKADDCEENVKETCKEEVKQKECKDPDVFYHRETVCLPDCGKTEPCQVKPKPCEKKPEPCEKKPEPCEKKPEKRQTDCGKKLIKCGPKNPKKEKKQKKSAKKKSSGSCDGDDPYCCVKKFSTSTDSAETAVITLQDFWSQRENKNSSRFMSAPTRSLIDHIIRKQIGSGLLSSRYLQALSKADYSQCGRCGHPKFKPDVRRRQRRYEFFDNNSSSGQCNRCRKYEALAENECARCAKYEVYKDVENGVKKSDLEEEEEEEEPPKKSIEEICEEQQKAEGAMCIKPACGQGTWDEIRSLPAEDIKKILPQEKKPKVVISKECIRKKIMTVLNRDVPVHPCLKPCKKPCSKPRFQLKQEVVKLKPPEGKKNYLQKYLVQPKKIGRFFSNKFQEAVEPKINSCKPAEKPVQPSKRRPAGYLQPPVHRPKPNDVRNEICRRDQPPCPKIKPQ